MNSIIKKIILVTIFVLPFFILKYSFYPMILSKSLFFEGATLILATLWIIDRLFKKEKNTIPKNIVFLIFIIYVLVLLISSFTGFVPALSFWGSIDHGTGVIFMLCLFIFSLITGSVFKKVEDWYKLFTVFIVSGIVFTIGTFLSEMGIHFSKILNISSASGFLIGNSSWTGVYLAFVFFISLGITFSSKLKGQKIIGILGLLTAFLNPTLTGFVAQAPGASFGPIGLAKTGSYSVLVGIGLFILYLFFRKISSIKWRKIFVISFIAISLIGVLYVSFIGFSSMRQWVSEKAGPNRFVFWDISVSGFKEKPLLGWGGDTYQFVYAKYFNPIVTTPGYAPEYWVDRSHNIYFDEIVSSGIIGFSLLMFLYGIILFGLIRKAINDRGKEGILYMALFVAVVSFLIQGLMIFQINIGWIMVSILIAFVANFCFKDRSVAVVVIKNKDRNEDHSLRNLVPIFIVIVFCFLFNYIVIKPYKIAKGLAEFPHMHYQERMDFFKKLDNSYVGNTTDLGNAFIPYHMRLRQILQEGLKDEEKKLMIEEIKEINRVLDNSLKKQKYQEFKILASMTGFYSLIVSLTDGQERQKYYDEGMFYIEKMRIASPKNPITNAAKALLGVSLEYGESSIDILNGIDKKK